VAHRIDHLQRAIGRPVAIHIGRRHVDREELRPDAAFLEAGYIGVARSGARARTCPYVETFDVRLGTSLWVSMSSVERCTRITSASEMVLLCPPANKAVTAARSRRVLISTYCNNLIEYGYRKFCRVEVFHAAPEQAHAFLA